MTAAVPPSPDPNAYPVRLTIDRDQRMHPLWGIPLVGVVVRWILLIPHFIVVWVLGVLAGLSVLVTWIAVLVLGRLPDWATDLYILTYRWTVRVAAYATLMTADYPPFSIDAPYAVDLHVDPGVGINRLWGIPFLGVWVRGLVVIPHSIVLALIGFVAAMAMLVVWIPVLVSGRFPSLGYDLFGAYLRLSSRISLWTLMVALPYPPIVPAE